MLITIKTYSFQDEIVNISFIEMMANAGLMVKFVMFILLLFSVGSWSIILMKFWTFRKVSRSSEEFLDRFWECKDLNEAQAAAQEHNFSPEAVIFVSGYDELQRIRRARSGRGKDETTLETQLATMDNLKRAIRKARSIEFDRLSHTLPFLATTGSASPFVGLFGTVWGIMNSFHEIGTRGSASLAVVAPGISEALIATAIGLAVAIPAVIFFNYFSNKLEDLSSEVDNFSTDFLNIIERDILSRA